MRIFSGIDNLPEFKNAVITIGSFDGVHQGHQGILKRINQLAQEIDGESVVITFDPHPRQIIYPKDDGLLLLSTTNEKRILFEKYDIDNLVIVPFSFEFSRQDPREYIEKFLVGKFQPKCIVIGYDHRFGLNRTGDVNLLRQCESQYGYEVLQIQKQELDNITISSTKIRAALLQGDIETSNRFLNHFYRLTGKVVHGEKIGKTLGFPTANLKVENQYKLIPKEGIYAVYVYHQGMKYHGMMYIGDRPTLPRIKGKSIEVNIFDFDDNLYEEEISIEIVQFLREDHKFDDLEGLKNQLFIDRKQAKLALGELTEDSLKSRIAIAILNYNGREYLESFLPSVLESSNSEDIDVVVIDNHSSDKSVDYIKEWHPEVKLIEFRKNYGFAEGYNRGLRQMDYEYIVLLNSDVLVEDGWLDGIIRHMDNNKTVAACQPKILSLEHKDHFEYAGAAGGMMDFLAYPFCAGRIFDTIEKDLGQYDDLVEIFWSSGAAMVIRKDLFEKIGGFDPSYFAHMEEIDLCWRLQRAGYKIHSVNSSKVYHLGGGTLDYGNARKTYLNFRNNLATLIKNNASINLIWLFPLRLILDGIAGLKYASGGNFDSTWAIIKSHFYVYTNIFNIYKRKSDYNKLVRALSKSSPYRAKLFSKSILWQYYVRGKKKYQDLI